MATLTKSMNSNSSNMIGTIYVWEQSVKVSHSVELYYVLRFRITVWKN